VNYGSGTPAEAAAWVTHSRTTPGDGVALWEVGNENYGCWEVNNPLAQAPEDFQGYKPQDFATCPQTTQGNATGTQTLATSYAVNAQPFLVAMKKADPAAQIGVPWAFGSTVAGASVPDNTEWNDTVLGQDGRYVSFVDAHYYPFSFSGATGGSNPTDQQVLQGLMSVPSLYRQIRGELDAYDPEAQVVVGETGGNTGASCTNPDFGMFTSGSPPAPETPYYGYVLASVLARPDALLATMGTSDPADVLAYQSRLSAGTEAVAFINTNTSSAETVSFRPGVPLRDQLRTWTYSAASQNATDSAIVQGTMNASSLAQGITLPPESMVVLESR